MAGAPALPLTRVRPACTRFAPVSDQPAAALEAIMVRVPGHLNGRRACVLV